MNILNHIFEMKITIQEMLSYIVKTQINPKRSNCWVVLFILSTIVFLLPVVISATNITSDLSHMHTIFASNPLLLSANPNPLEVVPKPKNVQLKSTKSFINIDDNWVILFDAVSSPPETYPVDTNPYHFAAQELQAVAAHAGINLKIIPFRDNTLLNRNNAIIIGDFAKNKTFADYCKGKKMDPSGIPYNSEDQRYKECYIITISAEETQHQIVIGGMGAAGVYYGVKTLIQKLELSTQVRSMTIIDFPDMCWRGLYRDFKHFPAPTNAGAQYKVSRKSSKIPVILKEIKTYSDMKLNTVIFLGHEFLNMNRNRQFLQKIFRECRLRFITPIPSLPSRMCHYGRYAGKLWSKEKAITLSSGYWVRDEPFKIDVDGYVVPFHPMRNLITNGSFEKDKNEDGVPDGWRMESINSKNRWSKAHVKDDDFASVMKLHVDHQKAFYMINLIPQGAARMRDLVEVQPSSLYYLTYSAKSQDKKLQAIRSRIRQYDKRGKEITDVYTWPLDLDVRHQWNRYWIPIYTNESCRFLKIQLKPGAARRHRIFIDKVGLFRTNGCLLNVIQTKISSIEVKSNNGSIVYQEGKDYQVFEGPFHTNPKQPLYMLKSTKIRTINGSRLNPGDQVKVSYDSALLHPFFRRVKLSPSSPLTYQMYKDLFQGLLSLKPKYINLNLDEYHGGFNRDSRCVLRNMSNAAIFAKHINVLSAIVKQEGVVEPLPGFKITGLGQRHIRVIMFDDMVNSWHYRKDLHPAFGAKAGQVYPAMPSTMKAGATKHKEVKNFETIEEDIIMSSWWYGTDRHHKMINCKSYYETKGFDYFGCPWKDQKNIRQWAKLLKNSKALGIVKATWGGSLNGLKKVAEVSWNN